MPDLALRMEAKGQELTNKNVVIFGANSASGKFGNLHPVFFLFFNYNYHVFVRLTTRCRVKIYILFKSVESDLQSLRRQCPFAVIDHYNFDSPRGRNFKQLTEPRFTTWSAFFPF